MMMWYMFPIQCEELRIDQTLVGSCGGHIILRTSSDVVFILQFGVAFQRVVLREVYFEGPNRV